MFLSFFVVFFISLSKVVIKSDAFRVGFAKIPLVSRYLTELCASEEEINEIFKKYGIGGDVENSEEVPNEILQEIEANAPSEWEMRKNILGITPITIAGFALAAVIMSLNGLLGYGWAGNVVQKIISPNYNPPKNDRVVRQAYRVEGEIGGPKISIFPLDEE